jgi:glycosyltransferase involved in cell wall biosynthesis
LKSTPDVGFVLFGDGPLRKPLARQIAARGLGDRFILAGFHSDLDRYFPHLDLFVQSSFTEGLPNVVLEAMAAGVPVVATAVGGTPEIIVDGVNGYLVPAGSPSALAEQTIRILIDDAQREAMGERARQRVEGAFSFMSQAQAYASLFEELIVRKPPVAPVPAAERCAAPSAKPPPTATRPVRVCFVIDRLGIAGTETQLLALIRGLNRGIVQPCLCLLDGNDDLSRELEPADCPTIRLGVRSLHQPSTLRAAWRFGRFLRRHRIDVVQTYFPDSTYFAVPVARLAGVKHIVRTRRDLGHWVRPVDRWLGRLYNRFTTAVVANCEACRRAVIEQEGAVPDSVVVLANGIDPGPFQPIPPYTGSTNGQLRQVGMVANLRPVKAPDVFVRAAAIVATAHPNVTFQIAGAGDEGSLRQLARECGIENRLTLRGMVRDIPSFLSRLDVAVLTSHAEGLSNSLIEYMAAGRPIVATAVGGNTELLEDGVHGLLVPPANPAAVAKAIDCLLGNPALGERLGRAARRRIAERFGTSSMARRYEEFFLDLVRRRAS